jgi:hypothetical protein
MFTATPWFAEAAQVVEPVSRASQRAQFEALSLVGAQSRAMLDFPTRLADCRTPQEAAVATAQFWRTAIEQQFEGGRRIMEAWASAWQPGERVTGAFSASPARDVLSFPDAADPATEPAHKPGSLRIVAA